MFFCTQVGKRVVMLHSFVKKSDRTPKAERKIAEARLKEMKNAACGRSSRARTCERQTFPFGCNAAQIREGLRQAANFAGRKWVTWNQISTKDPGDWSPPTKVYADGTCRRR